MGTLGNISAFSRAGVRFLAARRKRCSRRVLRSASPTPSRARTAIPTRWVNRGRPRDAHALRRRRRHSFRAGGGVRCLRSGAGQSPRNGTQRARPQCHVSDAAQHRAVRATIRQDARAIDGMVRFPHSAGLPWHADRPAIALYDTLASDGRLSADVRDAARGARDAVADPFSPTVKATASLLSRARIIRTRRDLRTLSTDAPPDRFVGAGGFGNR